MQPIPCAHCGNNFMRHNLNPELPRLCNNCEIREEKRNPKEKKMETIDIVLTVPREDHIAIEEHCINHGIDFSKYFLELHKANTIFERESKRLSENSQNGKSEEIQDEQKLSKKAGKK
jgi:hypothetical protein